MPTGLRTTQMEVAQALAQRRIPRQGLHDIVALPDLRHIHQRLLEPHLRACVPGAGRQSAPPRPDRAHRLARQ